MSEQRLTSRFVTNVFPLLLPQLLLAIAVAGWWTGHEVLIWLGLGTLGILLAVTVVAGLVLGVRYPFFVVNGWSSFGRSEKWVYGFFAVIIALGLIAVTVAGVTLIVQSI